MVRTMFSVNRPGWPETPISTVGAALATTSARPIWSGCSRRQSATAARACAKGSLEVEQARHSLDHQPVAIDGIEAPARFLRRQAGVDHLAQQQRADAAAGGAGADDRDPVLAQRQTGHMNGGQQGSGRHRRRSLDVVVEGAQAVAIAREQAPGIGLREILPLQQHMRPALGDRGDEAVDEFIIVAAANALVPPADVKRVGEALAIVGAGIEQDRQGGGGMQAGAGAVERELPDRDAHAACALVAETEHALAVADHDRLDRIEARIFQDLLDPVALRPAQKQPARLRPDMTEELAAFADRRGVDERQRLLEMAGQEAIEQGLIGVLQSAQENITLEVGPQRTQRLAAGG